MDHLDTEHCHCFRCLLETTAMALIDSGRLDPWDYPLMLAQILARIVNEHASAVERHRRAMFFADMLYAAARQPMTREASETMQAEIISGPWPSTDRGNAH